MSFASPLRRCDLLPAHASPRPAARYAVGARAVPLSRRAVGMAFPAFTSRCGLQQGAWISGLFRGWGGQGLAFPAFTSRRMPAAGACRGRVERGNALRLPALPAAGAHVWQCQLGVGVRAGASEQEAGRRAGMGSSSSSPSVRGCSSSLPPRAGPRLHPHPTCSLVVIRSILLFNRGGIKDTEVGWRGLLLCWACGGGLRMHEGPRRWAAPRLGCAACAERAGLLCQAAALPAPQPAIHYPPARPPAHPTPHLPCLGRSSTAGWTASWRTAPRTRCLCTQRARAPWASARCRSSAVRREPAGAAGLHSLLR